MAADPSSTGEEYTTVDIHRRLTGGISSVMASIVAITVAMTPSPTAATVPGSNGKIAFVSLRDGSGDIFVMNADGSGQTKLAAHPAFDGNPSWSPDGTKIAFSSQRISPVNSEIFVMNADGSGLTRLTFNDWHDGEPAWSPDGSKIAFSSNTPTGVTELFVMNADGSGATQLTTNAAFDFSPEWSPDGSRIAFQRYNEVGTDIYVMNADGSAESRLTFTGDEAGPSWSPDGARIAFNSIRDGDWEIYAMNADGSGQVNLTQSAATGESFPNWSPDGSKISFNMETAGNTDVWTMNADGSARTKVTDHAALDFSASWQPIPSADLAVGVAATPDVARSGKAMTYVITVQNAGPSNAQGVVVTDTLPPGARFVSVQPSKGSCVSPAPGATGTITCTLGFLPNAQNATTQIVVKVVAKKTTMTNTAWVTSATPDPNAANNTASIATQVR